MTSTPPPHDPGPHWGAAGIHGIPRLRRWDAVATAEAIDLSGAEVHFVALPDGVLLVDEDVPDGSLEPLAAALEAAVQPPYRAEAVRRGGAIWAVAAQRIEVAELREDIRGDAVTLAVGDGERSLLVDDAPAVGHVAELEELGRRQTGGESFVVQARRLEASLWEVSAHPL